jgi:hypothetical protein
MVSLPILAINRITSQIYPLFKARVDFRRFGYACQLLTTAKIGLKIILGQNSGHKKLDGVFGCQYKWSDFLFNLIPIKMYLREALCPEL